MSSRFPIELIDVEICGTRNEMRLVLACLILFLAPAGALLVCERYVSGIEDEFLKDSRGQVQRLQSVYDLYPPRARKMPSGPAILQLRALTDGDHVARLVCTGSNASFHRLFDNLDARCGRWFLLRRARGSALFAVGLTAAVFGLILMARITVQRYASRELWPGNWTMWFVLRGLTILLIGQIVASLAGYGVILQTITGKTALTLAILIVPFAALLFLERKLVLAFVEPRRLNVFRPRGVAGPRRRPAPAR
jgi:hypothetical protein